MKILYVVRGLNQSSGTTHAIIPMAEEMARRGHEVWLYAVRKPAGTAEVMPDPKLVQTRLFDMSLPLDHPGISFGFARSIQDVIGGFDLVHIQAVRNFVTWWTMRCALKQNVPYIVAPQGSYDPWVLARRSLLNGIWDRLLEIPLLNRAARIQCLTTREAEQVNAIGISSPCVVIPNGVAMQKDDGGNLKPETGSLKLEKQNARKSLGITDDTVVVLFLGRLDPKKGLDVLIHAFGQVVKQMSGAKLIIAGNDGGSGYGSSLSEVARNAGIKVGECAGKLPADCADIVFAGEISGEIKESWLCAADVFVLTSLSEGMPVAVLEAIAAGLPVVITDQCNLPEVAEARAGIVTSMDTGKLAEALKRLTENRELRKEMGVNARTLAAERFSWQSVTEELLNVYSKVSTSVR